MRWCQTFALALVFEFVSFRCYIVLNLDRSTFIKTELKFDRMMRMVRVLTLPRARWILTRISLASVDISTHRWNAPEIRGLHSSTFQLNVSTVCGLQTSTFPLDVSTLCGLCSEVASAKNVSG